MYSERDNAMEQPWRGLARSHDNDEITFVVSKCSEPELHVETDSGALAARLGKGSYFFKSKQYEADDPRAP